MYAYMTEPALTACVTDTEALSGGKSEEAVAMVVQEGGVGWCELNWSAQPPD